MRACVDDEPIATHVAQLITCALDITHLAAVEQAPYSDLSRG